MIIKANSRKGGTQLGNYLLAENDNQRVIVLDQRGTLLDISTDGLAGILNAWEKEALAVTKGEKPLYHMQLRLAPDETLSIDQWLKTLDVVEKKLKLSEHPRAVVAHDLGGERHLHVVYSRLDRERCTLLSMSHDRKHMLATCRQLEKEFGLRQLDSTPNRVRNGNQKTRSAEHRMAKEVGVTREELCRMVETAWNESKTGRQFQLHLERFGMTMTRGERRDYNVWHAGKRYDPVRLLESVRTAEFRAKMQLDPPRIGEAAQTAERATANDNRPQPVPERQRDAAEAPSGQQPARRQAQYLTQGETRRWFDPATPNPVRRHAPHLTQAQAVSDLSVDRQSSVRPQQPIPRKAKNMFQRDLANELGGTPPESAVEPRHPAAAQSWEALVARRRRELATSQEHTPQHETDQERDTQISMDFGPS